MSPVSTQPTVPNVSTHTCTKTNATKPVPPAPIYSTSNNAKIAYPPVYNARVNSLASHVSQATSTIIRIASPNAPKVCGIIPITLHVPSRVRIISISRNWCAISMAVGVS